MGTYCTRKAAMLYCTVPVTGGRCSSDQVLSIMFYSRIFNTNLHNMQARSIPAYLSVTITELATGPDDGASHPLRNKLQ